MSMNKKIAIVHDFLITYGGAERVLEALHEIWPDSSVFTAWVDWEWVRKNKPEWLGWKIKTSWFDKIPFKKQLCSPLRLLTPFIWKDVSRQLAKENYDAVISSSAWYMSKGVGLWQFKIGRKPYHVCYCHTPPRYLYGYETSRTSNRLVKLYSYLVNPFMRYYDWQSSQTVDLFIANSDNVRQRIRKFYRQEAMVVYPPVTQVKSYKLKAGSEKINKQNKSEGYFLMVNRLVASKNIEVGIEACLQLGVPLKIVGEGPLEKSYKLKVISYKLEDKRDKLVEFLGYVGDKELSEFYQNCKAVIYLPKDEDFGIVPVEAMSFGKPVIAINSGGTKETVIDGKTGILIIEPTTELVAQAIQNLAKKQPEYWTENCQKQAAKFGKERFKEEIKKIVFNPSLLNSRSFNSYF
jgi:glycosyltransferase involved in cell wall biosynthesis